MRIVIDGKKTSDYVHDSNTIELTNVKDGVEVTIKKHFYDSAHADYNDIKLSVTVDGEELLEAIKKTLS